MMKALSIPQAWASFRSTGLTRCLGFAFLLLLAGCQDGGRVPLDTTDRFAPKYAYELHEFALLKLKANQVQELEQQKRYAEIYDELTSQYFQKRISRRDFLLQANCVETFLGDITEYERLNASFDRKNTDNITEDVVIRRVQRSKEPIQERIGFVWAETDFKLSRLEWATKNPYFKQCLAEISNADPDSEPESITEEPSSTEPPQAAE